MSSELEYPALDWEGRGYAAFTAPPAGPGRPDEGDEDPWLLWVTALDKARRGDFSKVPPVLEASDESPDPVFVQSSYYLLGDAGPDPCFPGIVENAEMPSDTDRVIWSCNALMERGRLADIPILLEAYLRHSGNQDAGIIALYIHDMLGREDLIDPGEFESLAAYRDAVISAHQGLLDQFGTDAVCIYRGERFHVPRMARAILDALHQPHFRMSARRKFEAVTGIDCSEFYREKRLQPLTAATIVEEFLESPEVEKYEEGVRYFFGHRIPD
jgi:hypothetical protein